MKYLKYLSTLILIITVETIYCQNVGIGNTQFTPDSSAILEIRGNKGLLIPRMTTADRDAIINPAQSLLIFNTTTKCFETFVNGHWHSMWCDSCSSINLTTSASPSAICIGNSTILSASGADSYLWNTGDNTAIITVTPSASTTYTVTGTSAGCSATAAVNITVNSSPTIIASASPSAICIGNSTILSASGADSYLWNTGDNTASITVTPSTSTTYTVTGTSAGCSATATVNITVNSSPTIMASASHSAICIGNSTILSASGADSYLWNTGDNTASITVTPSTSTTYTVTGTSAGCSATATVNITVNSSPTIIASASPSAICIGNSTILSASGADSYLWDTGDNTASITVTPSASTTYTVTGTSAGCSATATVNITVNSVIPTISASASPSTICSGSSSTLSANGASTYQWSTGSTNQTIAVSPTSTTTYTVTGTTSGCSSTATITVNVNPSPSVTISAYPTTICSDSSSTLTASGATTYSWSTGSTNQTITVSPTSTTTYTVTGTTSGCSSTATVSITVQTCCTPVSPCPSAGPVTYNGFTYHTVQIGTQCWMIENLRTTKYSDGTDLTDGTNSTVWINTITTGKWCPTYPGVGDGLFYDGYAAVSTKNICPTGWHVPTKSDFETLQASAGGTSEGNKLKDNVTWNGTNSCGWKGVYGGYRAGGSGTYYDHNTSGTFCYGVWWSKTTGTSGSQYYVDFRLYDNGGIQINNYGSLRTDGRYIRCIKD